MREENRCYISGPITGVEGFLERFNQYEVDLRAKFGWSILNPARIMDGMPEDTTYDEFVMLSETLMHMCDRIFLMPGWEKSKGARFEREFALIYQMDIYEEINGEIKLVVDFSKEVN